MNWLTLEWYGAAISMILGYVPQAITTIRTRDTEGIAMPTFIMMGLGSAFFVAVGIMEGVWAIWLTNVITLLCSIIIFSIKIYNDRRARHARQG